MTDWARVPVPLSRPVILQMMAGEAEERREAIARQRAAEERAEEIQGQAQAYYREHGEWEWETRQREADLVARAERIAEQRRETERAEAQQAQFARLIESGRQPRTVAEILATAALYP